MRRGNVSGVLPANSLQLKILGVTGPWLTNPLNATGGAVLAPTLQKRDQLKALGRLIFIFTQPRNGARRAYLKYFSVWQIAISQRSADLDTFYAGICMSTQSSLIFKGPPRHRTQKALEILQSTYVDQKVEIRMMKSKNVSDTKAT
jgi:hypothetical protein